ncbi:hypothetical protein EBV26_15665 [bacterium]|jgi:hypothetical protein|nr:hypothetical protein [bacterium]
MGFPPSPPYNPTISKVPVLDSSSGDPMSRKDPKSISSVGANIQAMQDQAKADRLYDAPVKEGFADILATPWITSSQACRRVQGFTDMGSNSKSLHPLAAVIFTAGALLVLGSFL